MLSRRDAIVAVIAAVVTLSGVAAVNQARPGVMGETVWDWHQLQAHQTPYGETRILARAPTATLDELELHATTLNPGEAPHPPHKHPNEELIILEKGTVEALVNGQWKRLGPGSVIFNASNVTHGLRNAGDTPAQYQVVSWRTDKTPKS
jgi:XRE family transcriptional regulator, regulator of sulfur utilization